jgi:hypothetical protein
LEERRLNVPFLVTAIILVVVIALGIVFYINTSNNFSTDRASVSNLKAQVTSLQTQLTAANNAAAALQNDLNTAKTQITKLEGQLATTNTQLTSVNTQVTSVKDQITTLQKQLTDTTNLLNGVKNDLTTQGTKVTALDTAISALNTKVTALQATVTTLTTQVNNLTTVANNPVTLASNISVTATAAAPQYFATLISNNSGSIQVVSNTALATGVVKLYYNSTNNLLGDYSFSGGTTVNIPVTSGVQYLLYFGNSASSGSITAVVNATFYPGGSGGTNQTTLFSNYAVSQNYGASTTVHNFTASVSGYVTISGTSSSSSSYIEFYNLTSPGSSATQIFGSGTTLNFNVVSGNAYDIKFWNLNSGSGTVTATLTGVYNRY